MWGPSLLRGLVQRRDVLIFDNMAQVWSSGAHTLLLMQGEPWPALASVGLHTHGRWSCCCATGPAASSRRCPAPPPRQQAHPAAASACRACQRRLCQPRGPSHLPCWKRQGAALIAAGGREGESEKEGEGGRHACCCPCGRGALGALPARTCLAPTAPPGAPWLPLPRAAGHPGFLRCPQPDAPPHRGLVPGRRRGAEAGGAPPAPRQQGGLAGSQGPGRASFALSSPLLLPAPCLQRSMLCSTACPCCPSCCKQVVSWAGTSPDGRAVTGSLATMRRLFNPNNTDED